MGSTFHVPPSSKPGGSPPSALLLRHPLRFVCAWRGKTAGYFPFHDHPVVELVYHPTGSGVTTLGDGRKIAFEPYGTVIYPAWVQHDQQMTALGTDICVHIELPGRADEAAALFSQAYYIPPSGPGSRRGDRYVHSEFLQLAQLRADPLRQVELDLRTTALVARLLQLGRPVDGAPSRPSAELYREAARRYIRENYADIAGMGEVAAHTGVSEDYLRHLFSGGTSLNQLLNRVKTERAKELLLHSSLALKEIAAQCGYRNERYFSTRFKKQTGISPGAFRQKLQRSLRA